MLRDRSFQCVLFVIPLALLAYALRPETARRDDPDGIFWNKVSSPAVHDVVVAGDSRTLQGVSPQAMIQAGAGQKILNFGFNAACLNRRYLTAAAEKLDTGKKRCVLVIALTPLGLSRHSEAASNFNWYAKASGPELVFRKILTPIEHFVEPYQFREELKKVSVSHAQRFPDGWLASYVNEENSTLMHGMYRNILSKSPVAPELVADLARCIKEFSARGIRVAVFRMPSHWEHQQLEDEVSQWNEAEMKEKMVSAGAAWLQFDSRKYKYYDGVHMQASSASQFSADLAVQLQAAFK
ncbi:MAG TPA: hypothetical protein VEK08_17860 [Planctomycetota bacterium]|nr:hypothetical protein [Planctomycetota bacterium]